MKQILCFHENQDYIRDIVIAGGTEKLSQWKCARCGSHRYSEPTTKIGDVMQRYRTKNGWHTRHIVIHNPVGKRRTIVR